MFDFVRKPFLWQALDSGLDREIKKTGSFHLKSVQDLAVYQVVREASGKRIAEIGGGDSRLLPKLAQNNHCSNVEKFDGTHGGPNQPVPMEGVEIINSYLGEQDSRLGDASFDIVFSVSVVEHVPADQLSAFHDDQFRILKPGGMFVHAIDMYVEDEPSAAAAERFNAYRRWVAEDDRVIAAGEVFAGSARFTCDLVTNPDNVMYNWGRIAPSLNGLRQRAQSVSLLVGGIRR